VLNRIQVRPEFWDELHRACFSVVEMGTAVRAKIPGLAFGGKTGSAENHRTGQQKKTHSWFVGFAPVDNPQIAIAVVAENAGHGSEVAAPVASRLVEYYLRTRVKSPAQAPDAKFTRKD
jgi:cell division protein FtsI/penicillin-binding protein 2